MRNVLITGASGNLGTALIPVLFQKGFNLYACSGHTPLPGDLVNMVQDYQEVDLSQEREAEEYIAKLVSNHPGLDAAVLLVGGYAGGGLRKTDDSLLDRMIQLNFKTAFHVTRPLLEHFEKNGGGQFVLIGARPAVDAGTGKNMVAYTLSKSLVLHLSTLINSYGKGKNMHATVIVPGTIDTAENRAAMPDADFTAWVSREDLAESIAFVLSEAGSNLRDSVLKMYKEA